MQRFDARLVNDACGNKDVLMKEAFDGLFVRYEDVEAELATLRSENDNLKRLLLAASHALRSYEYGNASTELAKSMADSIDQATQKVSE